MPPTVSDPATSQSPTVCPACHHLDGAAEHNRNRRPPIAGSRAPAFQANPRVRPRIPVNSHELSLHVFVPRHDAVIP